MRKVLKWIGIIVGGLIGLLLLATVFVTISSSTRINKTYDIQPENIAVHNNDETLARGQHLAEIGCADCHGANYAGGAVLGSPHDALPAPNLTPAGNLAGWSEADFIATIRSGFTPEGRQLDSKEMPWPTYGKMTDEELQAVWLFLQTLPAAEKS